MNTLLSLVALVVVVAAVVYIYRTFAPSASNGSDSTDNDHTNSTCDAQCPVHTYSNCATCENCGWCDNVCVSGNRDGPYDGRRCNKYVHLGQCQWGCDNIHSRSRWLPQWWGDNGLAPERTTVMVRPPSIWWGGRRRRESEEDGTTDAEAVSYTHQTLPTKA